MSYRWPSKIFWRLMAAIFPLVVFSVCGIVIFQYGAARRQILKAIDNEMRFRAQRMALNIDDQLEQCERDLSTLAESPLIADYYHNVDFQLMNEAAAYRNELERYLIRFAQRRPVYAQIYYLDSTGHEVASIRQDPISRIDHHRFEPYFTSALKLPINSIWISSIGPSPRATSSIYFSKPIYNEQSLLKGVLVLCYDLKTLVTMLGQIEVGTKGRAYILTDTGQRIYKGMAKTYTGELLTASSNLIKRPWSVIVEAPRDEFLGPLRSVRNAAFLTSFLGLGLLIVVLSTIVRSITKPIQALVIAARAIGSGDLSYRIKNSASDELGTLSQSFNEMSERLDSNRKQNVQLQSQLIQAEKLSAVGQLIAAVAHELNNPLAAISGYVQMAQLDAIPKKLQEDLSHVYNNVLRCRKVVDNLLFFVRQSGPERKKFSLNDAVRSALELLEYRLLKTEDVEVRSELNHTTPEIVGDFQQIVQVIVNLISNSCDAMEGVVRYPETKKLVIRSGFAGDKVFLDIEDNGSGIPAEIQNKIFEPFFTTKDAGHGTGLGLPICQQIVQAHGGEISVRSLQSQGTIFHLEFPVANITAQEQVNEDSEEKVFAAVPAKKILVADDEKDIANLISRLLTADGDLVDVAYNGGDALDIIGRKDFDLIISDIEMEHAKGMDLYSALSRKRAFPKTKMLFITGDILNPKVLEFLSQTKSEYLVKPFDIEALRQAARRLLS